MNPDLPITDAQLCESIRITRSLAWVSSFHRDYLAALEDKARSRNLNPFLSASAGENPPVLK